MLDPGTPKTFSPRPGPCLISKAWSASPAPPFPTGPVSPRRWHPGPPSQDKPAWTPPPDPAILPFAPGGPKQTTAGFAAPCRGSQGPGYNKGHGAGPKNPIPGPPTSTFFYFLPSTRGSPIWPLTRFCFFLALSPSSSSFQGGPSWSPAGDACYSHCFLQILRNWPPAKVLCSLPSCFKSVARTIIGTCDNVHMF